MSRYVLGTTIAGSFEEVKKQVVAALKNEGFGVLTEINVQQTLKEKIGAEMEPYVILGACNPKAAHQALSFDRDIGLLLPCNVVLRGLDGQVEVHILDPEAMFTLTDPATQQNLGTLPKEMKQRLQQALTSLK